MIDEYIRQLQNPDPDVRKRAIMALGKAKAPSALKPLANVVRTDPDAELRELARKAGQYIRQQMQKATRTVDDKDMPTTSMLHPRSSQPTAPPPPQQPPLRRSERKALETNPQPPPPPPIKKVVRSLANDDMPETGTLLGQKVPVAPPPAPKPAAEPPAPPVSPFVNEPSYDDEDDLPNSVNNSSLYDEDEQDSPLPIYNVSSNEDEQELSLPSYDASPDEDEQDLSLPSYDDSPDEEDSFIPGATNTATAAPSVIDDLPDFPPGLGDEEPIEPLRAPPLYYETEPEAAPKADEAQPVVKGSSLVKGRKYNVTKQDEERARGYLDGALSQNLEGDNAKAMKSLTQAISLNPNLINDGFFSNVASSITGLEGDAAAQMIIDRNERKRFTDDATRKQKDQRVEKHLTEAKQSGWADVWFEVGIFTVVVIVGTIVASLVANEATKQLLVNLAQISKGSPAQLQTLQTSLSRTTTASLLPSGIITGVVTVITLLFQTVLIHYLSKALGGVGTWRHLVQVLLSFYNHWTWLIFVILCIAIYLGISTFSPVTLCPMIVLLGLTLYVTGKTSSKVGEAYDFGGAKGCLTVTLSSIVIFLINLAVFFVMFQSLHLVVN